MSLQDTLQKKIDRKNSELDELRDKKAKIDSEIMSGEAYIEGLQDAIKSADKSESARKSASTRASAPRAVKAGSSTDKAQQALRRLGKPTHISELLVEMGIEDSTANQRNVSSSLSQSYRIGRIFTRPESKTFGLIEWDSSDGSEIEEREPDPDDEHEAWLESLSEQEYESHNEGGMHIN